MKNYAIHSVYKATEGEGIFIGTPQVFVRFQGCAVGCLNCDSMETWEFIAPKYNLDDILEMIESQASLDKGKIKRVSITGGDPLHPKHEKHVLSLIIKLHELGYTTNIEAAGTRVVTSIFDEVDYISFDFKTPSTGVKFNEKVFQRFVENYADKSQIKAVIADEIDFNTYLSLYDKYNSIYKNWVITPCYEPKEEFPLERFKNIIDLNQSYGGPFRVIGQQHKWLYGSDKRNV
ncbi:MAG: 7-carboxy-7-deazaguanine synthase QueE [Bacteriovoracaceae bacterium]|jgi:7-carboxy-7-deazaguanine synthase|nr:7-carboxy-7-deazaguanine synthase QueE [Bacteriovoracaceae bacterium]